MNRVNRILAHRDFQGLMAQLEKAERGRIFCGHGMEHLLSVARLMALIAMEEQLSIPRPLIYGAALVHDLGRAEEYRGGRSHEEAGPELAAPILADCGFSFQEQAMILAAVREHRSNWQGRRSPLGELLFRADKGSRPCFACQARPDCSWPPEKQNLTLLR